MRIVIEAELHVEHPCYKAPQTAHELLEALSKWVVTADFRWKIGDGPWQKETAPTSFYSTRRRE